MIPEWNSFINANCMDYLKDFPDNYFSLAICDPPYGGGFTEGGGCQGWFAKYHQTSGEDIGGGGKRFGGRFDRYKAEQNRTEQNRTEQIP